MNARFKTFGLCAIGLLAISSVKAQYTFFTLDDPVGVYGTTSAYSISGRRIVGGYYDANNTQNGFVYNLDTGVYTTLDDPAENGGCTALGVSGSFVVGDFRTVPGDGFSTQSYLYNLSTTNFISINDPQAVLTQAYGVSQDYVVGIWDLNDQVNHGFVYNISTGAYSNFDDPAAGLATYQGTSANGVSGNNVVGNYVDSNNSSHGFIYNIATGKFATVDDPFGANGTWLAGISGELTAGYYRDASSLLHGFVYNTRLKSFTTVDDPLGAQGTGLGGISGTSVVGTYFDNNGLRHGFVAMLPQNLFVSEGGAGEIVEITPDGTLTVFASGLIGPNGLVFNSSGDLFVACSGNGAVYEFAPDGTQTTFASGLGQPYGLAIDSSNNVFVALPSADEVLMITPGGVKSVFASGLSSPNALAMDASNNLFVANNYANEIIKITPNGIQSVFASGLDYPQGMTVNTAGDLFESDAYSGDIYEFSTNGTKTLFATVPPYEDGEAFDALGNLYVADGNQIYEFATNGSISTFASGLPGNTELAFGPGRGQIPPGITSQPVSATVAPGGDVTLKFQASGSPLFYQWSLNGTNIPGATFASLTLDDISSAETGLYTVTVYNGLGSVTSQSVSVASVTVQKFDGVVVSGLIGAQYAIQSAPALNPTNWTTLTNITLSSQPYVYIDYASPSNPSQHYRALPLAP